MPRIHDAYTPYMFALDALKHAESTRAAAPACRRAEGNRTSVRALAPFKVPQALVRKHPPGSRTGAHRMVETDECRDVRTRGGPHCDGASHAFALPLQSLETA